MVKQPTTEEKNNKEELDKDRKEGGDKEKGEEEKGKDEKDKEKKGEKEKPEKKEKPKAAEVLAKEKVKTVEFVLLLGLALLNDLADYFGVDLILFRAVDIFTGLFLWLWAMIKLNKFPTKKFMGTWLIELLPFIGDLSPTWTIFVLSIYLQQKGFTLTEGATKKLASIKKQQ